MGGRENQVGYDAGKKVKGRKIHALVDTEGLPMRVIVDSTLPRSRIATAPGWCSTRYDRGLPEPHHAFQSSLGSNSSGPMAATTRVAG